MERCGEVWGGVGRCGEVRFDDVTLQVRCLYLERADGDALVAREVHVGAPRRPACRRELERRRDADHVARGECGEEDALLAGPDGARGPGEAEDGLGGVEL